jgi:hypothetical protein
MRSSTVSTIMGAMTPRVRADYKSASRILALLTLLLSSACAGPNLTNVPRVPLAELAQGKLGPELHNGLTPPFVLQVHTGDQLPIELILDSRLAKLDATQVTLTATRNFYVLFRSDGPPLLSEDGSDFSSRDKNAFRLGLRVQKGRPAALEVGLRIRADDTP